MHSVSACKEINFILRRGCGCVTYILHFIARGMQNPLVYGLLQNCNNDYPPYFRKGVFRFSFLGSYTKHIESG